MNIIVTIRFQGEKIKKMELKANIIPSLKKSQISALANRQGIRF